MTLIGVTLFFVHFTFSRNNKHKIESSTIYNEKRELNFQHLDDKKNLFYGEDKSLSSLLQQDSYKKKT